MHADVYNLKNEVVGEVELSDKIFGVKWNPRLVHQALVAQLANARRPWAHAKTRAEVRGGGRKPWRQKGTGRARHGSTRSPLWVGGGKAHGPSNLRDYSQKINKKMKRLAIMSAISKKMRDKEVKIFENFNIEKPKTKILSEILRPIFNQQKNVKKFDLLLVAEKENKNLVRASRNLIKTKATLPESLNVYDILNYKNIFIDRSSAEIMGKHYKL